MIRTLRPELLDSLPPEHPDAQGSRRDLRLINRVMGNHRWFERTLPALLQPGERVLELGSGEGDLGLRLAARGAPVDGLDLCPRPATWTTDRAWHAADVRTFSSFDDYPAIIGNLIFHQFSDDELSILGAHLRRSARVIVACEPLRCRRSQLLLSLLGPVVRANRVTRHDARVSVAAGFRPGELALRLGLTDGAWRISCSATTLGAVRMVAVRNS